MISTPVTSQSIRVLIIDDETQIRDGLKASLQASGFSVTLAASGEEGIHAIRQAEDPFHAVLSDYRMAGLNGFDVLKEMKKISPKTRAI